MIGSWRLNKEELFGPGISLGENVVHVLVVVPTSVSVDEPLGSEVDLDSCDDLLAFLESDMADKEAIISRPHNWTDESLDFRLVGREQAIDTASECFNNIIKNAKNAALDRTQVAMPVCSGISGLGKTRMLEEGGKILQQVTKLDPKHVVSVIVPYCDGFNPEPVEQSMSIQASFSWRLLYRFFLDYNCSHSFQEWFTWRLPSNGDQLSLQSVVKVIERKLRKKLQEPAALLYLFLGVDDYEKIERVGARQNGSKTSILRELVEIIASLVCTQSSSLILLPMFAGKDLGAIESSSIANSSNYVTNRLPMGLLSMQQVFRIAMSNVRYARLLKQAQVCRHLFYLGGVPRWVVDYLTTLRNTCEAGKPLSLDNIIDCFDKIWARYVDAYLSRLQIQKLVRLAAVAVSGQMVDPNDTFDGDFKWSKLRDSWLCLLIPRKSSSPGACDVRVPYLLLWSIGSRHAMLKTNEERAFASALNDLHALVDTTMFDLPPWQSWEMFGACFYAVRINALLVLGLSTVTLGELLPGTMMSVKTRSISVELLPSRVFRCTDTFGASSPQRISRQGNPLETIDWTSGDWIAVNDDNGVGVDIFFTLKEAATDNVVVFVDQRKRQFGKFQPCHAKDYIDKLSVCPDFLVARGARFVGGIMDCVSPSNLEKFVVPDDCFILSQAGTELFTALWRIIQRVRLSSPSTRHAKPPSRQCFKAVRKKWIKSLGKL
ncbi:hypothetical protein PF005_g8071 [Phytophthora fragariae]|nr:hypothetical protein PF003_g8866 [Phytophthora fragariae]KAE8941237.1 hypothetical protein PF009_g8970 [Phytophthora fragariae]KAE9119714.1 hypothetical protein PF007_g8449 [Phytophthora fragariae]KAE9147958.1 hypothetical protein PF006_g7411 [Phytophthora fragariae]KAE9218916.1 hypothetical protein PF005_g8071 [Phytophthora fragariae]